MKIDWYMYTDKGSRDHNEDAAMFWENDKRSFAVLCDGLGGHNCGEVASRNAVESIKTTFSEAPNVDYGTIYNAVKQTNDMLINQQITNPELKGMRTTAVGCVVENDKMNYFNVGDSRFYFFRRGALFAMTKDHSVSQMSVALGEMSFSDIRNDVDRNKLLKVLGEKINGDICSVYKEIDLQEGDAFLLCSDGFWEYVLESEMEIDLSKAENSKSWAEFMLVRLFLRMNGNNDNFTILAGIVGKN
jgi:serine/threonine protein phosphatase PrpC